MKYACHSPRAPRRGTAIVEFAVTLPLVMMLLLGVWEIGRMVEVQQMLTNAAREGGRQASTGIRTTAQVQQSVLQYLQTNNLDTTGVTPTIANLTNAARTKLVNSSPPDPTIDTQRGDWLQITATLPYQNVRWSPSNYFVTSSTTLTGTAVWMCMKDATLVVDTTLPVN